MPKETNSNSFKPIVSKDILMGLTKYYGYAKKAQDGRAYIVFTTLPEQTTELDGISVQASFRPIDFVKPNKIYLDNVSHEAFADVIAKNDDSNVFWCAPGATPNDTNVILSEKVFHQHATEYNLG